VIPGYPTLTTPSGVPYLDRANLPAPIQWVLAYRHTNALTLTTRDIVDNARMRHHLFADVEMPDGAAILWVNQRERYLLLTYRDGLKGVATKTVRTIATLPAPGYRIGVTPRGTPYLLDADEQPGDGYAVYLSDWTKAPYIDQAGVPIADKPLDDGWPLPVEVISTMAMKAQFSGGDELPIAIKLENERTVGLPGRQLTAFASGNRVAPMQRPGYPMASTGWGSVLATELSYIPLTRITNICCLVSFPAVLAEALVAGLAERFAKQAKGCTPAEQAQFANEARMAEKLLDDASSDILGELPSRSVVFKG